MWVSQVECGFIALLPAGLYKRPRPLPATGTTALAHVGAAQTFNTESPWRPDCTGCPGLGAFPLTSALS